MLTAFDRGPGLYWQTEVPTQEEAPTTGVAGFLGSVTLVGQTGPDARRPYLVTRWETLRTILAQTAADPYLLAAVRGFFENGGKRCYVILIQDVWSRLADQTERWRLIQSGLEAGLEQLEALEEVDLVAAPYLQTLPRDAGNTSLLELQRRLLRFCRERGDCFALLDGVPGPVPLETLKAQGATLSADEGAANGALYYPWVRVPGSCSSCHGTARAEGGRPCSACEGTGAGAIPPSGHIAGIFARVDTRVGTYRAPANEEIEGIVDLQCPVSATDHAALEAVGVNLLRAFQGRGLKVWGARTLSSQPEWRWISVRRLFLTVGRWLRRSMANVVFEPSDLRLWIRIDRELTAYFESLFRQGALKGKQPGEAFYVRCNEEINPPEVRAQGRLVVEVGLAPTVPKEFIVLRLVRGADGVSVMT